MPRPRKYDYMHDLPIKIQLHMKLPSRVITKFENELKLDARDIAILCEKYLTTYSDNNGKIKIIEED